MSDRSGDYLDGWLHDGEEDEASVPMLQEPRGAAIGPRGTLSPLAFYALTQQERSDLSGLGDDFGLVEEKCDTISKNGVQLLSRWYTHPEIAAYTTGDKKGPQRKMVIRYDRALAARGVLEEIQLLAVDDHGRYTPLLQLLPHERVKERWSSDDLVRRRNALLNALLRKRSDAEQAYAAIQRGEEMVDRLIDDTIARERLQRKHREAPRPAAPIVDGEEPGGNEGELGSALEQRDALVPTQGAGTVTQPDEGDATNMGLANTLNGAPQATSSVNSDDDPNPEAGQSALGEALGGTIGFRRRT